MVEYYHVLPQNIKFGTPYHIPSYRVPVRTTHLRDLITGGSEVMLNRVACEEVQFNLSLINL